MEGLRTPQKIDRENTLSDDLNEFSNIIKSQFSRIRNQLNSNEMNHIETKYVSAIIKRNYEGPTSVRCMMNPNRPEIKQKKFLELTKKDYGAVAVEFLNLANGDFSIEEVFLILEVQFPGITEEDVLFFVKLFHEEGLITVTNNAIFQTDLFNKI